MSSCVPDVLVEESLNQRGPTTNKQSRLIPSHKIMEYITTVSQDEQDHNVSYAPARYSISRRPKPRLPPSGPSAVPSSSTVLDSLDHYFGPKKTNSTTVRAASPQPEEPSAIAAVAVADSSLGTQPPATQHRKSHAGKKRAVDDDDEATCDSGSAKKKRRISWDERYEQLKAFKAEHGHTRVPFKGV